MSRNRLVIPVVILLISIFSKNLYFFNFWSIDLDTMVMQSLDNYSFALMEEQRGDDEKLSISMNRLITDRRTHYKEFYRSGLPANPTTLV